jgi:chromosome partitioning protein
MFEWLQDIIAALEQALNKPIVRLISYVVGPVLALVSFAFGMRERARLQRMMLRLVKNARRLGRMKEQASQESLRVAEMQRDLDRTKAEVLDKESAVLKLRAELEGITKGSAQLWGLRPKQPFDDYEKLMLSREGPRIVTFGNLKGGVGKSTLAANFAAYISETLKKPVLVIDLDYQGSLSNMMMLAAEKEIEKSEVDKLLQDDADLATLADAQKHLVPTLAQAWLVPASFSLAQLENQLLLHWLLNERSVVDVRYRLARILLRPEIRHLFSAVIIDTPPRMSIGTVNALVASHYFVVPTTLDTLGARAVPQFIINMTAIKSDLGLKLDLAGVVGMMSREESLNGREIAALDAARIGAENWKKGEDFVLGTTIPRREAIANAAGEALAYFGRDDKGKLSDRFFDPLFADIAKRIMLTNH